MLLVYGCGKRIKEVNRCGVVNLQRDSVGVASGGQVERARRKPKYSLPQQIAATKDLSSHQSIGWRTGQRP